jgi:hypothetical protein
LAAKHGLYLDKKGKRAARPGRKVSWMDRFGNQHDLDYVLELGGTEDTIGIPVAFIEVAWRGYTKHSRNKAQEIQGAILPLAETHHHAAPFLGAVLAGVFTKGALDQLRSHGFTVLYVPYDDVKRAFARVGIHADFDEDTSDKEFSKKIRAWMALSEKQRATVPRTLLDGILEDVAHFAERLEKAITRRVALVRVLPLHGAPTELRSIRDAIDFIRSYEEHAQPTGFVRYEVEVRYSNGDDVKAEFAERASAIAFLSGLVAVPVSSVAQKKASQRTK